MNLNLQNEIKKIEDKPLTVSDLLKYNYKIQVGHILYSDIKNYNSINELFQNNLGLIILIDRGQKIGHFVCLLKKKNNIEFFGPYGYTISEILNIMNINDLSLLKLFNKSNFRIIYNKYQYEEESNKIESCGLHTITRLLKYNLTNEQYHKWLRYKNLKPDEIVSLLTYFK